MRTQIALLLAGSAFIVGAFLLSGIRERGHAEDLRGIAGLRVLLDSTRGALAAATTATDSTRIAREVTEREFYLGRRTFHVPLRQESIDAWWTLRGEGARFLILGALCILAAGVLTIRRKTSPDPTSRGSNG
jgi:hypothetical protein